MLQLYVAIGSIAAVSVLAIMSLYYGAEAFRAASDDVLPQRPGRFPASPLLLTGTAMLAFAMFMIGASSVVSL